MTNYYLVPEKKTQDKTAHGPYNNLEYALKVMKQFIENGDGSFILLHQIGRGEGIITADIVLDEPVESPWYPDDSGKWIEFNAGETPPDTTEKVYIISRRCRQEQSWIYKDDPSFVEHWDWTKMRAAPEGEIVAYKIKEN